MTHLSLFIISVNLIIFLASISSTESSNNVVFEVMNPASSTPGGLRFNKEMGVSHSIQVLSNATDFIWNLFQENVDAATRKDYQNVNLFINNIINETSFTSNNNIHLSADYINTFPDDVKQEITGILYHETTHIWQWPGNASTPSGLIEGIADFVRLKAGYAPQKWKRDGRGNRWDQGFDVTARFLDYCNGLKDGFVTELNKKMRNGYSDTYFVDILGKTTDQLWSQYKAKQQRK